MSRYPYKLLGILPNANENGFRNQIKSFVPKSNPLPTILESLSPNPNPNTPTTHKLVSFNLSDKMKSDFINNEINFEFWVILNSSDSTVNQFSENLDGISPLGAFWNSEGFVEGSNFFRRYNASI